ncbi:MAG: hypothetical protein ABIJ53_01520 [Verrucomicrobiota bacterium]
MDYQVLKPGDSNYPDKLTQRMGAEAPVLYYHGPLKLLKRFSMAVICADLASARAMLASNEMLFKIREYALNYIGPWHAVMETEIFRLAMDTPTDPLRLRSVTMLTIRGLLQETWDNFLGDRFGYKGPFTGFPQKEEYYRRAKAGELLVLSITEPNRKRIERPNILLRNWVACALADVVFTPSSEKGTKSFNAIKRTVKAGIPIFTCQYDPDKEQDVNKQLFDMGITAYNRKTVGPYLESLGAKTTGEPPFPPPVEEPDPEPITQDTGPVSLPTGKRFKQMSLL